MEVSVKLIRVLFGIATGFWNTFVLGGGGSVAIPGIQSLMGPIIYYRSFVLEPQCVGCLVAGVIC